MSIAFKRYRELQAAYLAPQWRQAALLAMAVLLGTALQLARPQIMRGFLDAIVSARPSGELAGAAALFLATAVAGQGVMGLTIYLSQAISWSATNALRLDLTRHCLGLGISFHKEHSPGELVQRVDGDVSALGTFLSQFVINMLSSALLSASTIVLLFVEDWRVGLVALGYGLMVLVILRRLRHSVTEAYRQHRQNEADLLGFLGERLMGTEDIKANGAVHHVMEQLEQLMRALQRSGVRAGLRWQLTATASMAVHWLAYILALGIGGALYMRGTLTIGGVYLVARYFAALEGPLDDVRHHLTDLQQATASIERIDELLQIALYPPQKPKVRLPYGPLGVRFEEITFSYQGGNLGGARDDAAPREVLSGISFELAPGGVLGLLGRTGSGKSTLSRLLFRLYDPDSGRITLSGSDLRDLSARDLCDRVGMVTQEVQILGATLRENVTLFRADILDSQILDAVRGLGLSQWFDALPSGLDTLMSPGGANLSAGEAQLIALVRVSLRDPGLVILDEASSRLDPATEHLLQRAMDDLLRDRTAIIIAHRIATAARADEIMILEDGRIVEHGGQGELAADPCSLYRQLLDVRPAAGEEALA